MIATLGSILLACCGIPESIKCFKTKSCDIGYPMLLMWLFGEILLIIFAIQSRQFPLLINYIANLTFVTVMLYYK